MIRVGIAGLGFMGMVHYLTYQKKRGVQIAAVCEQDKRRLAGDWRGIQGNFGPAGKKMDLSGIAAYSDLDELIADPTLDVIDITLPPFLHADAAVKALRAGKHVFCEKPMSLTLRDCNRMDAAARRADRLLMVGHVLPFGPEYAWARKTVQSGKYGRLLGGSFTRVISDPAWLKNYWSAEHVGGPMLDLHVHDAHFIRLLFGMPKSIVACGRLRNELPEFWHSQFDFGPGGPVVQATSGAINQQGLSFKQGFEIHLEQATLMFEFAVIGGKASYLCEPTLLNNKGKVQHPRLSDGDPMLAFADEIREVMNCVKQETPSEILDARLAKDAILLCQKQSESLRRGRPVRL